MPQDVAIFQPSENTLVKCVCVCVCVRAHVFIYLECFEQFDIDTQGRLKNYRNAICR